MAKILQITNDLYPEFDLDFNGYFYETETQDTGVIYRVWNMVEDRSYIGRAHSYMEKHGEMFEYGAKGRFRFHWMLATGNTKRNNDCPVFYEAIRRSNIDDWFVFTIKVCSKEDLKDRETSSIKKYNTSNPKFGYNIFVGNNKPDHKEYLEKYVKSKVESNKKRAEGGKMKRVEHNKNLPTNISYYPVKENDVLVREGYMARIKIDKITYKKVFLSMDEEMKIKLKKAIKYIELIKQKTSNSGSKTNKHEKEIITKGGVRKVDKSKNLPTNIRYYADKKNGEIVSEGYAVEMRICKKRYKKCFTATYETMETKLEKAVEQVKIYKLLREKEMKKASGKNSKKSSGSKTAKKNYVSAKLNK